MVVQRHIDISPNALRGAPQEGSKVGLVLDTDRAVLGFRKELVLGFRAVCLEMTVCEQGS